jgi:YidC/Oxa1 family membrane protein insertase
MIGAAFHTWVYLPIYNALVYFVDVVPSHDIGIAVIVVTIIVRIILYPLAKKAIRSQMAIKAIQPELEELKKKFKDKPEEQGRAMFALYRERKVNPFSGLFLLLIQLPILLGLYWVFAQGGFPVVDPTLLYSFVLMPEHVNMNFLGLIDMGGKSVILAVLVGITQALYTRLSMGPSTPRAPRASQSKTEVSFSEEMARSFDVQARYVLPVIIGIVSYFVAAAAPLYWVTSNIFMIMQELIAGRRFSTAEVKKTGQ